MIGIVDVEIQAANPSIQLFPMRAFQGSPSSIRVRNVPKKIGDWVISKVFFTVAYPDNSVHTTECKLIGGVYVGTVDGCNKVGVQKNGYSIFADGVDENGDEVKNYCLGKGDVYILDADGIIEPENSQLMRIYEEQPTTPNDGDMWQVDGAWYVWQNNQAWAIGDDSGLIDGKLDFDISDVPPWEPGDYSKGDYCTYNGAYYKYIYDGTQYDGDAPNVNQNWLPCSFQMRLSDTQESAIDSVVDERATTIRFNDDTSATFNWSGEINHQTTVDDGLYDEQGRRWAKPITSIELGKGVTSIANITFRSCTSLSNLFIPDSVTSIGQGAFSSAIFTSVTIPNSVTSIGIMAFQNCSNLTSIIVEGKTQAEAEALLANTGVSASIVKAWNAASQEWVDANFVTQTEFQNTVGDIESILNAI